MYYKVIILFDGVAGGKRQRVFLENDFLSIIKKTEEFLSGYADSAPQIISAEQILGEESQDIKLKVIQTIKERRN